MAWDGYATFAGVEIYNRARTQRYMRDAAPGVLNDCDCDCGALHEVVGDQPYSNPAMDDAPWYDPDVPASAEFCGLYPLSVRGLDDSTRTADVTQIIGDGATISGRRFASREVRVRGILLGSSEEGLQYGHDWLSSVLDGSCGSCDGDTFCFFATCPDPDRVPRRRVSSTVDPSVLTAAGGDWDGAVFSPSSSRARLWTPRMSRPLPCSVSYEWTVQGPAGATVRLQAGGEVERGGGEQVFLLTGQWQKIVVDDMGHSQRWASSSLAVGVDAGGIVPSESLSPSNTLVPDQQQSTVRPPAVQVHAVRVTHTIDHADAYSAATSYLRQLRDVYALEGPRVIQERHRGTLHMREVDFTLGAMRAHVFSQEIPIAALHSGRQAVSTTGRIERVSLEVPDCVPPADTTLPSIGPYGIVDPDRPRIPPPPILDPLVLDGDLRRPEDNYIITVPDASLPTWTDMLPVLRLGTAHLPVRNVRVRFFPVTMEGMRHTDLSGCDACGGFVINYIPPNSEITLDGMTERASVRFNGTSRDHPANHLLSSDGGRVFTWPVLSCGMGYFVALDVDFVTLPALSLSLVARR